MTDKALSGDAAEPNQPPSNNRKKHSDFGKPQWLELAF
jgi:hypothetical protein